MKDRNNNVTNMRAGIQIHLENENVKNENVKYENAKNENVKYESEKFLESEKCGAAEVESPRMADAAFQQN